MTSKPQRRSHKRQRGQAMVEYSVVNLVLVIALVVSVNVKWFRTNTGPEDRRVNLIELFLEAFQNYHDSFFYVINLPFP